MSRKRIAVLSLAIGSAVLAAYLAKGVIGVKPEKETIEVNTVATDDVLVAAKEIQMGDKLAGGSAIWQAWPQKQITSLMITRTGDPEAKEKYEAARARVAIFEGEPIIQKKLVMPTETGFLSAILPKGYRAISVRISEETGVGGFILPNDRVDVLLTRKVDDDSSSGKVVTSETVVTNVRVLAINQTFKQSPDGDQVIPQGKTATLELNSTQAEVASMAETAGTLSLALRSIAENGDKGLGDTAPELADKYANGANGNDFTVVKYGIEKRVTNYH